MGSLESESGCPGFSPFFCNSVFHYWRSETPWVGLRPPGLRNVTIILPIWNIQLVAELCVCMWTHFSWLLLLTFSLALFCVLLAMQHHNWPSGPTNRQSHFLNPRIFSRCTKSISYQYLQTFTAVGGIYSICKILYDLLTLTTITFSAFSCKS